MNYENSTPVNDENSSKIKMKTVSIWGNFKTKRNVRNN